MVLKYFEGGKPMKKNGIALAIILIILVMTLVACGENDLDTCEHNVVIDEAVSATCTEMGLTEGKHCSKCGEVLLAQAEVPATNHTYSSDCDVICNVCEHERVSSVGHTYDNTCDTNCNDCGAVRTIAHSDVNPADNNCDNCGASVSALTFTLSDGGQSYAITDASSSIFGDITIPSTYNGKPVTRIGDSAFYGCTSLTSITVPDSVTTIGSSAFQQCERLTSIVIPDSVTSIGSYAFSSCDSLTSIDIPDSVTSIGSYAFSSCDSLTSITVPDSVTTIGSSAFQQCDSLTSIVIPDSVTSIGSYAFRNCTSLTNITIPDSVTSIGSYAFRNCTSLTNITIPDSVTTIGSNSFYNCDSLTRISVDENNPNYKSIDGNLYSKDGKTLIQYAIGKTATSFVLPDSVTTIGSYAFSSCDSLTSVTFGENSQLTTISSSAFSGTSLTSIVIPDSVTTIGAAAFSGTSLTSVTFGENSQLTTIGSSAFYECYKLVEVYNKSSLNITKGSSDYGYVGYYALNVYTEEGGSKLSTDENGFIIYTDGEDKILVGYTGSKTDLIISDGIKEIYKYVFSDCSSLTSITIPDSVTSIGEYAFAWCYSLTDVYYTGTEKQWNAIEINDTDWGNDAMYNATIHYNYVNE